MSGNPPLIWHHAHLDPSLMEYTPPLLGKRPKPDWLESEEARCKIPKPRLESETSRAVAESQTGDAYGRQLLWVTHPLRFKSETEGVSDLGFKLIGSFSTTPDGSLALMTARRIILVSPAAIPYTPKVALSLEGMPIQMTVRKTQYPNVLTLDYPARTKSKAALARRCEMILSDPFGNTFRLGNLFFRQSATISKKQFTNTPRSPLLESSLLDAEASWFGSKEIIHHFKENRKLSKDLIQTHIARGSRERVLDTTLLADLIVDIQRSAGHEFPSTPVNLKECKQALEAIKEGSTLVARVKVAPQPLLASSDPTATYLRCSKAVEGLTLKYPWSCYLMPNNSPHERALSAITSEERMNTKDSCEKYSAPEYWRAPPLTLGNLIRGYLTRSKAETPDISQKMVLAAIKRRVAPTSWWPAGQSECIRRFAELHFLKKPVRGILDPCAGFGGRALGAAALGMPTGEDDRTPFYIGIDPNASIGYAKIKEVAASAGSRAKIEVINAEFQAHDTVLKIKSILGDWGVPPEQAGDISYRPFDLSGTSPPFFNRENYTEDSTQACERFPAYAQWRENFLKPLVTRQMALSKVCWIHIKPVWDSKGKTTYNLAEDVRTLVKENGGHLLGDLAVASATRKGCSQKHEPSVEFTEALAELNRTPYNMGSQGRPLTRTRPIECDPLIFFCHETAMKHLKTQEEQRGKT